MCYFCVETCTERIVGPCFERLDRARCLNRPRDRQCTFASWQTISRRNMQNIQDTEEMCEESACGSYTVTWREILNILRYGREISIISKRISEEAGEILKYIHCHGKGRDSQEYASVQSTITHMLQKRYLRVVLLHQLKPNYDLENDMRNRELEKIGFSRIGEAKKRKEVLKNIKKNLENLKDEEMDPKLGFRRKDLDPIEQKYKRRKKNIDSSYVLDENVFLRVNHEKFVAISRDADLVQLVESRMGKVTAQVYGHILRQLEIQNNNNNQENTITTISILQTLPKGIDLSKTFITIPDNDNESVKKDSDEEMPSINDIYPNEIPDKMAIDTNGFSRELEENDISRIYDLNYRERLKHIIQHLEALSQDSYPLLFKIETRHFGKWKVDYKQLSSLLQELEYEKIIEHKFGYIATRLLRIIREKGKVDEKQLASIAFLKQQSIRPILMALTEIGALDIQEIPRRSERQPSNNIYQEICYYHKYLKNELKQRQKLLTKIERTDVQEHEKELLPANEQQELKYIRAIEEKVLIQISRLDRLIMILRDY
ncbi:hypothetical protein MERGE_000565 [Pneumocystis wakefieldiae]|uniref:DNA-directed RNA polymerase III subunit RPC3 n=1 Tax=Pneumocystis wakefieldiae TaxID=38082 RepID=A0A899FQH4_9ASCO|nr:hypothetical protein MERGE_000565 [Pneumocystis wakefieldiae]